MPDMTTTIITSAITTMVVAPLAAVAFAPRIEARNRVIQSAFKSREECSTHLLAILGYCALLTEAQIPKRASPKVTQAIRGERDRWRDAIDESSRYLIDHLHGYALTFHDAMGVKRDLIQTAGVLRMTWISDRPEPEKLELLTKITEDLQSLYFGGLRNNILHPMRAIERRDRLKSMLQELEGAPAAEANESPQA